MTDHELILPYNLIARLKHFRQSSPLSLTVWIAFTYLLCLAAAEILTTIYAPILGLALHGLLFVTLLVYASLVNHLRQRRFLLVFALVPLIRLLSLSIPLTLFPIIYRFAVIGVPLLIAVFLAARAAGLNMRMTGFTRHTIPLQIMVGLTGFLLGYIEYLILRPAPLVATLRLELIWLPILILLVFTGFLEELIFRGVLQYSALQQLGRYGIPYMAAVYAVLHLGYHSALDVLFVYGVALVFGWFVWRTGSILGVSLSHGLTNITLYLVLPILLAQPISSTVVPPENVSTVKTIPNGMFITIPLFSAQETAPTPFQPRTPTLPAVLRMPSTLEATDQRSTLANGQTTNPSSTPVYTQPTSSPTQEKCLPPPGWITYIVRPGDTLSALSLALEISMRELQTANCLRNPKLIYVGQQLYVPYLPSSPTMPMPTATPIPPNIPIQRPTSTTPTSTPLFDTPTPALPTPATPINTFTPSKTPIPPNTPTDTFTPLPPSKTPAPPDTPTPAPTDTFTPLPPSKTPVPPDTTHTPAPTDTIGPLSKITPSLFMAPI